MAQFIAVWMPICFQFTESKNVQIWFLGQIELVHFSVFFGLYRGLDSLSAFCCQYCVVFAMQIIVHAGHHVYADRPHLFNNIVSRTCDMVDQPNAILRPLFPTVVKRQRIGPSVSSELDTIYRTPPNDIGDPVTPDL